MRRKGQGHSRSFRIQTGAPGAAFATETLQDESGARWTVWARLLHRAGRLIITELRLVPATWGVGFDHQGRWKDSEGCYGELPAPAGITPALVRRVPTGSLISYALSALTSPPIELDITMPGGGSRNVVVHRDGTHTAWPTPTTAKMREIARDWAASHDRIVRAVFPRLADGRPRPRRNSGRPDEFYAALAAEYLSAIVGGSRRPVRDVATARRLAPAKVRDRLHEARVRGLLSESKSGVIGGVLSPRAVELLNAGNAAAGPRARHRRVATEPGIVPAATRPRTSPSPRRSPKGRRVRR